MPSRSELSANPDFPGAATLLGAQIRLHQLGFYFGLRNGSPSALFDDAVAVFKISQGLPASPELDGATETALLSAYGS